MSDHPREAQRTMERVFLCNDIWFDCLPFLSRAKVGFEFALVSDRFDGLADAHLRSKKRPWKLGNLMIDRENGNEAIIIKNCYTKDEEHLSFPEEPLPDNVIGFKHITICSVDLKVIDFLCRIRRLFQPKNNGNDGIELQLLICFSQVRSWDLFFDSIWPLINSSAITKFCFYNHSVDDFRQRISPTFLLDWTNVRVVDFCFLIRFEDGANGQLLRQWLLTPREDGKPKLLKTYSDLYLQTVEQLKTAFRSAKTAVSFIIATMNCYDAVPFELDNLRTGERLTLRKVYNYKWLLERGPIGRRNVEKWAKWGREAMDRELDQHNLLDFWLDDNAIGPLDETAGPSGQSQKK